jgi:hypothetical protein
VSAEVLAVMVGFLVRIVVPFVVLFALGARFAPPSAVSSR